jgi:DNA-binding beta-propeller fold protein YncE
MRVFSFRGVLFSLLASMLLFTHGCWREERTPTGGEEGGEEVTFGLLGAITLRSPLRLALTSGGQVLVTDSRLDLVVEIDPTSQTPARGIAVSGQALGVVALGDRIFVGNGTRRTVEIFSTTTGSATGTFGAGAVEYPIDLAADDGQGLVFVLDGRAREVRVFDELGGLQRVISSPGSGPEQLATPMGIAVNGARNELLVSDWGVDGGAASIKIFDYDGRHVDQIPGEVSCGMSCPGGFSRPQGLAVDDRGRIYVADALLGTVLVFDRATKELTGEIGGRPELRVPTDVLITKNGDVLVVSNRSASVKVYPGVAAK